MKNFYLFSVCLILFCQNVKGALIWTNGGSNNNWNTATNWEDDGTLENRVPLNSDTLVFNSVNVANCTLKTTAGTCGAMNITSAYTGIFVVEGVTLTITTAGGLGGTFTMSGGTYNGGTTACTILGDYTLSGGTYNATSSNTILDGTNFTYSGGDFNAGTGKVFFRILSGAASKTINNVDTFNQVEFRNQGGGVGKTFTISNAVSGIMVEGLLTISGFSTVSDDVSLNTGIIHAKDGITFAGQAITSTGGTATIILDGTADQTITTSTTADNTKNFPNVTINKASGIAILASGSRLNTTGDFTIQSGTFRNIDQLVDGDAGISDDFTVQSGGTLEYSTATVNAPTGFNSIILNAGSTVSYTLDGLTGQTILDLDYSNLTLSAATTASAKTLPLASTVTVTGTLTINGFATLDMNTNSEDISIFSLDNNNTSDAISNTSNLITFTGSSAATIDDAATGTVTYGPVTFANTAGTSLNVIAGTIEFGNLTINGSRIFDPNAVDFNVAGNWTNNSGTGGFTPDATQQVTFTGDASRTVGGTGSTDFMDLNCNLGLTAARTLTFSSACSIFGALDVSDGQIVTGGILTLNSDASGTAAIANLSDESPEATPISGNVIAERFINEGGPEYYLLASPLTNATFEDWNGEFYMTGFTGTDDPTHDFKSVITRNEVAGTFPNPANTSETIANGTGYMCYIGNDGIGTDLPKTLNITGTVKTGGLTTAALPNTDNEISTLNRDGWHLLGNPYACPIIWDNVFGNAGTTNMNATAMRKLASGSYAAIPGGGTVASGEAFWVFAENALPDGAVEFQENDKSPTAADGYNTKHTGAPLSFNIILKQGTYEDSPAEIILTNSYLNFPTSVGYDKYLDAGKKTNQQGKENLATLINNNDSGGYIRNYIPDTVPQVTIPIRVWKAVPANITKTYSIDFTNVAALFDNNKCLTFEDTYAGISFPLTSDTTYTVSMNDTTYVPRFFIHISSPVTSSVTNIGCNGNVSGSVTATGSGSGPFNYTWKNQAGDTMRNVSSSTTDTLSNLTAGIYYLTVSNNGSCGTISTHFEITESQPITLSLNKTDVVCNGNSNGSASISISGGNSPFTYLWNTGAGTQNISSQPAAKYYVTVTDNSGCSKIDSVTISQPSAVTVNATAMNISCYGDSNGTAMSFASGGNSPYSYLWNTGGMTQNIASLPAAKYYITVTDNSGCSKIDSVTVTQPDSLSLAVSSNDVLCNGGNNGQASVSPSGGISPYSYLWNTGAETQNVASLPTGTYSVSVTDNNNCIRITSVTINEPGALALTSSSVDISCNGAGNGQASLTVNGGTSPYTYLWNTGDETQNVTSLFPGTYNVTVTDVNNCNTTASVSISEPPVLALNSSSTNISCNGSNDGSASITVNGGTSPYTYLWNSGGVTQNIASLSPGTYSVTVTDNNSCSSVTSVTISEPAIVSATGAASNASCGNSNGSAAVTATGGTGIHTYLWNTGAVTQSIASLSAGTFSVTVTDENGCSATVSVVVNNIDGPVTGIGSSTDVSCNGGSNGEASVSISGGTSPFTYLWSNGATQSQISNLTSQIYSVSVTDNIGCVGISSVTINEPSQILITSSSTDATCGNSNGSASVTISGGTGIHSLVWVTGDSVSAINNIPAGNYSITVTDENNCTQTSNIIVNNIGGPAVNILSSSDVSCNGGSNGQVTTNSTGGTSPYSYSWSNGGTTSNISGLPAGAYDLSVTDANNCTEIISTIINQPDAIAITSSVTNALCGNSDGTATISVTGGTSGYSYSWSNGVSTPTINNLAAGSYFVLVTDANGCTKMATVQINNTNGPSVNLQAVDEPSCNGLSDGTATVTGSGNSPFTYLWQNSSGDTLQLSSANQGSDILQNISSGSYSVLVKDINGCGSTVSFTVNQPAQVISSFSINSDTIDMAAGGNINLTNTSSGADSYSWDFGDGSTSTQFEPSHSYSSVGTYTITLTAMQGGQCTQSFQQTVVVINSVGIIENSVSPEVVIFQGGKHAIVQYNFSMLTDMEIGLFNILGQHVIPLKSFPVLNGSIEIALPETTGIYFLKVKTENSERVIKMYR